MTEIAAVARDCGADVPFERPVELSDDHTGTIPVVAHAIDWHQAHGHDPSQVCCIYATAPFIQSEDIHRSAETLIQSGADFSFSVTSFAFPIQRAIKLGTDGRVEMFDPVQFQTRSQDLPEAYHDAGQFYWGTRSTKLSGMPIFGAGSVPVILPRYRIQNINMPEDWEQAEALMQAISYQQAAQ